MFTLFQGESWIIHKEMHNQMNVTHNFIEYTVASLDFLFIFVSSWISILDRLSFKTRDIPNE